MDKLNKMKAEKEMVTSKADRKLYLGNLPPNITSNQLMQMLNTALKKMEINCSDDGDSIVSAWISPDGVGHYAFVEFRTAHEATAGLALNGASLYGYVTLLLLSNSNLDAPSSTSSTKSNSSMNSEVTETSIQSLERSTQWEGSSSSPKLKSDSPTLQAR